ncbi:ribosomal protein S6 kinase delta-1-like isoform X1 [Acipenser ruthenus]|uniref:ribosomal protein S6 kinase delta-1-like isoform X1 n=1 Tax=Acipenser ruthenus TaxID=7906 RepID=UPI00274172D6|nr:ribosomal protein S6 kinase delta-1-like isoform X1 [Acipenser ruthenus]
MKSQRDRGECARFYTVTDPKKHQKGYTVYQVTARIISRRNPEDVQEIIVWKRYSDFKKLHKDLWQIHKNLYRQSELFPPFAKAKVFGRFDETVIEERRQCAEDLLQFSANIPALFNSKQFEDFFKDGEVHDGSELIGPAEPFSDFLADSLSDCSSEVQKDLSGIDDLTFTSQSEYGGLSSDNDLISLRVDTDSLAEFDDGMASASDSPNKLLGGPSPEPTRKESVGHDPEMSKNGAEGGSRGVLFPGSQKTKMGKKDYLEKAGELIKLALQKEAEQDYEGAFSFYRSGVDLLLQGVQGEPSPTRREAVKKRTAEYIMRAEQISNQYLKASTENGSVQTVPPGQLSSRPTWNLRSPAEELKVFRVLGVIDKVLLVVDKRTHETFILKGLRKSSECSRNKKTIIPHCVPNMVRLHKYIISEDSIFLVLQHAEGGKLWSYVSKFLNKSPEDSFNIPCIERSHPTEVLNVEQLVPGLEDVDSSIESGGQSDGRTLQVLPMKISLTPTSQEDSSTQDEDGQDSSYGLLDSGATSEEECTNSYLTLCNEYEQEKIEPDSLSEEPLLKSEDDSASPHIGAQCSRPHSLLSNDSLCSPITAQELQFFTEDANPEVFSPTKTTDSLNQSKKSPMEFFRIDSKDSASDLVGLDLGDKLPSLKSEPVKHFCAVPVEDSSSSPIDTVEIKGGTANFVIVDSDRGSNESVPVISFQDAAFGDAGSCDEGRPDLLVNLPGVSDFSEEKLTLSKTCLIEEAKGSLTFGKPDVLQLNHNLGQGTTFKGTLDEDLFDSGKAISNTSGTTNEKDASIKFGPGTTIPLEKDQTLILGLKTENETVFDSFDSFSQEHVAAASLELQTSHNMDTLFVDVREISSVPPLSLHKPAGLDGNKGNSDNQVLLFVEEHQNNSKSEESNATGPCEEKVVGDKEVSQIFKDLDELLVLASQAHIPETLIQRWAVGLVVALDALHREGIVCRDLNPNNILLNDRGHIQLTYFSSWSEVEESCDSDAIDRMYCAPEVGSICEETEACDWWSLGALLFELLTGKSLYQCHPAGINRHTSLNMPDYVSEKAKSLVQQLLQFNPIERLGAGVAGVEEIKSHPFFSRVDWPN